ncbi:MAG TPA: radical SAM protein [Methanotrichaceae archaeon]|nr:radical SAM protein [Methanotrichaceae archaeon]
MIDTKYLTLNTGFKMTLNDCRTLKTWLDRDTWLLRIEGKVGDGTWVPDKGSTKPIWTEGRPWDDLAAKWSIPESEWTEFRQDVQGQVAEIEREANTENKEPEIPKEVLDEADRILDEGKAFEYVHGVWQKRHHGDENLGKALQLSIGGQSCVSCKGVHVHACGPRGLGKSDGTEKAAEVVPPKYLLVGSASPKALYYLGEKLPPGSIAYFDDNGWSEQAALMFKTCTTFYKDGATHTVVIDGEVLQFKTAPRIVFWITTADAQTDEQVQDRLLRVDITEDPKHIQEVIDFIFKQRKSGAATFDSGEIEVCRAIIYQLKQVFVDVVIPFAEYIRFNGDPRGATIFADLISSFAIWRHKIRDHDKNGAVVASYEDGKDAEAFFNAINGHGDTKFTPGERKVLKAIKDLGGSAAREAVMEKTGLSRGGLSDILNGRSNGEQAKYGLFHKCPSLTEEEESELIRESYEVRRGRKKRVLHLSENFNELEMYGKTVHIDGDETTIRRICSESSVKFGISSEDGAVSSDELVRKFDNNKREREERENHGYGEDENTSSPSQAEKARTLRTNSTDGDLSKDGVVNKSEPTNKSARTPALRAIYEPQAEAREYSGYALNLYSGCSHGCKYCYNKDRFDGPCDQQIKKASLGNIEHDLKALAGKDAVVHLPFVGDLYDLGRPNNSYTREVLELFKRYNHPFQILTKGGTLATSDFDLYFEGCRFGCTLTFDNEADSRTWEPGAALPADRIESLRQAHERGIETWVSLEPVIDPAQTLHLIELTHEFVDFYGVGKLNHDQRAKAIEYPKFRADAEALLKKYGKAYKIKAALAEAAPMPAFTAEELAALSWARDTLERQHLKVIPYSLAERVRSEKGLDIGPKRCGEWLAGAEA